MSEQDSMVERVARAICASEHGGNLGLANTYEGTACDAIAAMRTPTEAMLTMRGSNTAQNPSEATMYWREMIDACLQERP